MAFSIDLMQFPEFLALCKLVADQGEELRQLKASLPEWVDEAEAQRLTGLSRTTLFRERKSTTSLIRWKQDHGVRYERASLLSYNKSRAVVRGSLAVG